METARNIGFPSLFPNLPNLGAEVGKRNHLIMLALPNLPNLPNLFYARVHARVHVNKTLGRLGRLGSSRRISYLHFPTSAPRLGRLGMRVGNWVSTDSRSMPRGPGSALHDGSMPSGQMPMKLSCGSASRRLLQVATRR